MLLDLPERYRRWAEAMHLELAPRPLTFEENLGQAQALVGEWGYSIRVVLAPDLSTPDDPNDTVEQYIMER